MAQARRLVPTLTAGDRTEYWAADSADSGPYSAVFIWVHEISPRIPLSLK